MGRFSKRFLSKSGAEPSLVSNLVAKVESDLASLEAVVAPKSPSDQGNLEALIISMRTSLQEVRAKLEANQ